MRLPEGRAARAGRAGDGPRARGGVVAVHQVLEIRNWCRCSTHGLAVPACIMGARTLTVKGRERHCTQGTRVWVRLRAHPSDRYHSICSLMKGCDLGPRMGAHSEVGTVDLLVMCTFAWSVRLLPKEHIWPSNEATITTVTKRSECREAARPRSRRACIVGVGTTHYSRFATLWKRSSMFGPNVGKSVYGVRHDLRSQEEPPIYLLRSY